MAIDIPQDENSSDAVELFQDGERWVARHKDFNDFSGAGDTADEAIFDLMTVLESLQTGMNDQGC